MSIKKSASKNALQSEKRRLRNRARRSTVSTLLTKVERAIAAKDISAGKEAATALSKIDKAANRRVFHRNKAARLKSRVTRNLNILTPSLAEGDQPHTTAI